MAKKIRLVTIFKGAQGTSNYEIGAELQKLDAENKWEKTGKKVKNIKVDLKNDSVEVTLSDKTSIFFKGFPIGIDYDL